MGRSDIALTVRHSALHVWKTIISNTPRTLREILQTLFTLLLGCLASANFDKRQVYQTSRDYLFLLTRIFVFQIAAKTLADLVRKLGERVLPEIIPILEKGLDSPLSDQRQGVCIGLSEIMTACSRDYVSRPLIDGQEGMISIRLCSARSLHFPVRLFRRSSVPCSILWSRCVKQLRKPSRIFIQALVHKLSMKSYRSC